MKLRGTIVNSITPMNEHGRVDPKGIAKHVQNLIDQCVGGIWFLGSAGEDFSIGYEDRKIAARAIAEFADQIPIIIGLGSMSYDEIVDFIREFDGLGCDFHYLPYDQKLLGDAKIRCIHKISDFCVASKLWLYHNPKRGSGISVSEAVVLKKHPNIRGIKAGGYDLQHLIGMIDLHDDDDFQVYGAGGGQALTLYQMGVKAHMTSDANVWAYLHNKLYEEYQNGDITGARSTQQKITSLNRNLPKSENGENCVSEKYILSKLGICEKYVNPTYSQLKVEEERQLDSWMKSTSLFR